MLNRLYIQAHEGHPHYLTDAQVLALQKTLRLSPEEKDLAQVMQQLADPTKLTIYKLLHSVKELSVSDIAYILRVTQPAVSHALADLKTAGIVQSHRCGQLICYSLSEAAHKKTLREVILWEISKRLLFLS